MANGDQDGQDTSRGNAGMASAFQRGFGKGQKPKANKAKSNKAKSNVAINPTAIVA